MSALGSVLVVRLSSLGDVLFAFPAVQALVDGGLASRVAWLVEDRTAALLRHFQGLDETVVFPRSRRSRWLAHAAALRARRDDVVVDLQGNLKSRLQIGLMRAPRKVGYAPPIAREGAERALTEAVQPPPSAHHRVATHLAVMRHLGVPVPDPPARPRFALTDPVPDGVPAGRPRVVLHPGTSPFGAFKRWAPERFATLARALADAHRATVLVTGSPAEAALVDAVVAGSAGAARRAPTLSLAELAALLADADLVVAGDSLPLHLANALATPVVGLYGPKDPRVTGPYWDRATVVRGDAACSPCTLRRCSDVLCMHAIAPDAVLAAAAPWLAS